MNWLLFLKLENNEYKITQAGADIVPTQEYDKVLPTTERIVRQSDKVFFDGEKLKVKEGMSLLSVDELNALDSNQQPTETNQVTTIYDIN